jgi:hypothetical protein
MEGSPRRQPYRRSVGFPAVESRTCQFRRAAFRFYLLTSLMGSLPGARSAPSDIGYLSYVACRTYRPNALADQRF